MQTLATILSFTSGFALMDYNFPPSIMLATSIAVDLALAPLVAVIASRRGRRALVWAVAGLVLGMWALAAILLIPSPDAPGEHHDPPHYPPTSDAA